MTQEATQQGVSRQEQEREALVAKRAEERAEELAGEKGAELEPEPDVEPEPEVDVDDKKIDDTETPSENIPEPEPSAEPEMMEFMGPNDKVYKVPVSAAAKLKIDGKEVSTPIETVLSRYQKGAAGDKRLQEASNIRRELEAQQVDLTRREESFLKQMELAETAKDQGGLSKADYTKKVQDLAAALVEADEERAAELFQEVLPQYQQPAPVVEPEDLDNRVARKFAELQGQKDLQQAQSEFYDNYSDLAGDPFLFEMVDNKTAKIANENPDMPPSKIIKQAAEEVKEWRDEKFKQVAPAPVKKKKRSSPTPAGGRAKIGEDDPPPQTRKDTLNEMRVARGQPV